MRCFGILDSIYMCEFMKTVSNLRQNVHACLPAIAGGEAFVVLEKPGGLPSRMVGEDSPGTWLPADTKRGCQDLTPVGRGRVIERGTFLS